MNSSNHFSRGLGLLLMMIGVGIVALAILSEQRSLTTGFLGGAVLMSGLMTRTDARHNLPRRLTFAAVGAVLMLLYMLNR